MDKIIGAELKKSLIKIYGEVTKGIYGYGSNKLQVMLRPDTVIFFSSENRVAALKSLENDFLQIKQSVDNALFSEFKKRMRGKIKEELGLEPVALLRDFDAAYQLAVTVIVFGEDVFDC